MSDLQDAVFDALRRYGLVVLSDPTLFSKHVLDCIDPDSREAKVIRTACDGGFLEPLRLSTGSADARTLSAAADAMARYLNDEYVIDPIDAAGVSCSIVEGCSRFLGIETELDEASIAGIHGTRQANKRPTNEGRPTGVSLRTVFASVVVFILLACVATGIASHYVPIFGCTILPRVTTINGVECSWYVAKDEHANLRSIVFLKNSSGSWSTVSTRDSALSSNGIGRMLLGDGDSGLLVIEGDRGVKAISVTSADEGVSLSECLTWEYESDKNGEYIVLTNSSDELVSGIDDGIALAECGGRAGVLTITDFGATGKDSLWVGKNRFRIVDTLTIGDAVSTSKCSQLYIDGVLIPKADT